MDLPGFEQSTATPPEGLVTDLHPVDLRQISEEVKKILPDNIDSILR